MKGNVAQATNILIDLRKNYHIFCSVITYPVVPEGILMYRIIPTAAHSLEDVEYTLDAFAEVRKKLEQGYYDAEEIQNVSIQ